VRNKEKVEGGIAEAFTCKEITNFSSKYFSRYNNVNVHTTWYHIVKEVTLRELSIFQWKGKCVGAPSAHYITDDEWNYTMLYMYMNVEEVQPLRGRRSRLQDPEAGMIHCFSLSVSFSY
jgi:hypothetical protein